MGDYPDNIRIAQTLLGQQREISEAKARIAVLEQLADEMLAAVSVSGPAYGDGKWSRRSRWIDDDEIDGWRKIRAGEQ